MVTSREAFYEPIREMVKTLELADPKSRIDAINLAILDVGGSYVVPDVGDTKGTHLTEIQLHSITVVGFTEDQAILNWMRVAKQLDPAIEGDGFVTVHPKTYRPDASLTAREPAGREREQKV